ncbi:unnamed protein product [Peronospora destructor]|uniref:PPM-type phosphatase domain-containing protein n=1 Tax=Peronospora destructor TaxID=86335 RepID=A0AAV0V9F8_9STRA|nr:unnamed protein product [Peronospora destructor]
MGCILTKVGHDNDLGMPDHDLMLLQSHHLLRTKTTFLSMDLDDISVATRFQKEEMETKTRRRSRLVYGGGIPGVALDDDRVDLPEFTGVQEGGYTSINGRLSWGVRTRAGNDPLRRRKENQDAFCVCDAMADDSSATFFSVFDGHGPQGAFVSHFVREQYHRAVAEAYAELLLCVSNKNRSGVVVKKASVTCDIVAVLFQQAVRRVVEKLDASMIDISVSGTTAVAMLVRDKDVFMANLGDSRAVIARYLEEEQHYVIHCETKDHKPDVPEECARIERNNGRVLEWGSYRVWLQDVDTPGLAMSRSFGDSVAKTVGVTAEPDVTIVEKISFTSTDRRNGDRPAAFAVLASDGIWEFMTTAECIDFVAACIVDSGKSPQEACNALIEEAYDRWDAEEDVVDDITAALVYF